MRGNLADTELLGSAAKTFAQLPTVNVPNGARDFITDSNTTTFTADAAAGGSNNVPVYFNKATGTWKVG